MMKEFQSELFGKIDQPDSFPEMMELIVRTPVTSERLVMMWRGQADISWGIDSTAVRRLRLDGPPTESDLRKYEKELLVHATHKGFRNLNGMQLSDFDLLARLQHHGAATRLVDATRNALVALYFSACTRPRTTGLLIGFHTDFLGGYESEPKSEPYDAVVKDIFNHDYPQTWEPPAVSDRIVAQRSQFLYSAISREKTGSLFVPKKPNSVRAIAVSPSLKAIVLARLSETFDVRHITLFPDIEGFGFANSQAVRRTDSYRW